MIRSWKNRWNSQTKKHKKHISCTGGQIMKNILLVCNAGMSTSMLVQKMQAAAKEQGIEATIQAKSVTDAANEIDKADVLLLGPQVGYQKSEMEKLADGRIPVEVIDMRDYGTMNGKKVLAHALELIGE